jgi:foldase protein PrsA
VVYDSAAMPPTGRRNRHLLAVAATAAGLLVCLAAGCGDDDSDDAAAVATVGSVEITRPDFESAMRLARGREPDPRDRDECVAAKRHEVAAGDVGGPSEAELARRCRDDYEELRDFVMDSLIKAEWARQEAEARRIVLSDAEVDAFVSQARRSGFLRKDALRQAGVTEEQLLPRLLQNELRTKVAKDLAAESSAVSAEEVAQYYREHKNQVVVPERRDVRLVLTRSRARANEALRALKDGRTWAMVAADYSLHGASRERGGVIEDLREGADQSSLLAAIFRAPRGVLSGPVDDDDAWAVFVVEQVRPSFRATLEQATDDIRKHLSTKQRERGLAAFVQAYRAKTKCTPGFIVASCRNGPDEPGLASTF